MTNGLPSATESWLTMNELFKTVWRVLFAAFLTGCTIMFFGLVAKCYWLLFMLGWGVL